MYINMCIRLYEPVIQPVLQPLFLPFMYVQVMVALLAIYIYIYIAFKVRVPSWSQYLIYIYVYTSLRACNTGCIAASLLALNVPSGHGRTTCYIYINRYIYIYCPQCTVPIVVAIIYIYMSLRACNTDCIAASLLALNVHTGHGRTTCYIYIYLNRYIYCA
jgi:hypothetical protein